MKVLRVVTRLNIGGPARQALLLQQELPKRGIATLLVHGQPGDSEATFDTAAVIGSHAEVLAMPSLGRSLSALDDARAFAALLRAVFAYRPDVIHTHMAKAGTLGRLAGVCYNVLQPRRRRALIVHTFHGHVFHGYFGRAGSLLVRAIERALALVTDRVVAISPLQAVELIERFRIAPASKVRTVPLGFRLDPLLALPAAVPSDRTLRCVYVGRLVPIKDVETLLRGFALAARDHDISLRIVGDGTSRPSLEALAADLDLGQRVEFTGWEQRLEKIYRDVDAVLLSSLNEGTPVAVIEAMAAGRAVVATAVGGVPDVISDGVTGRLIPPSSPEAMARAIGELAQDRNLRLSFAKAGRAHVQGVYDGSRLVRDLCALYTEGLAAKRS